MQELLFLHSARPLMLVDICIKFHYASMYGLKVCMKFREDSLRGFQVTERTRFMTDKRTDGRGKTICLPILKGGGGGITRLCFGTNTAQRDVF